ncbi:hypothetical protein LG198_01185 [Methylobacillus arboreus]|uniref:hypothetical protein n=1 Tax=Methylobacillus arboreus TaxID=755170 RepID=UPI001E369F07|nr:hypothetical protein [Methylobacillus arboreus]MCB5189342.1 hypothetical protein [Methylobacillus arboreus]
MKNATLKLAVLGVFSIASTQAISAFVNIPTTGFPSSAYTRCMAQPTTIGGSATTVGNFGSGSVGNGNPTPAPTTTANNTCAIVPAPANDSTSPETNYTFVTSANRPIVVNNIYTSGNVTVGALLEVIWRKPAASAPVTPTPVCIVGTRVSLTNVAYSSVPALSGVRFEVNDLARGGLNGLTVDAAYALTTSTASPVYRIGRTYSSVQHRALAFAPNYGDQGGALPGVGYLDLPGLGSFPGSINGVNRFTGTAANTLPLANPATAQQEASVNDAWINFTFDANAVDDDGSSNPISAMTYVKFACNTDNAATINSAYNPTTNPGGWTRSDVIRLRQTAQEFSPFISVGTSGYVLPGQPAITPSSVAPF